MKSLSIIQQSNLSFGTNKITINFTKDMTPQEAANFLVKELEQWNNTALSTIVEINIK